MTPLLGTLSNKAILEARAAGLIVIEPFNEKNLGPNSYDVVLGEWFYREQNPSTRSPIYNIYSESSTARVWSGAPQKAKSYAHWMAYKWLPPNLENIAPDDHIILLAPGETILAHTVEFIGGRAQGYQAITTKMHARSSIGRSLLGVCKCAGLGDAGYVNRWTMEITSFSKHHWIPLVVGRRIAQIEFQHLASIDGSYKGKYQTSNDLKEIQQSWAPTMMLPRLHLDRELLYDVNQDLQSEPRAVEEPTGEVHGGEQRGLEGGTERPRH